MPYIFPVVKGNQKTTEYYVASLEFGEVDTLIKLPNDLYGDQLLDDELRMQRELSTARVRGDMKKYLTDYDDSFYSALTLFIVPRDLSPLEEGEGFEFKPIDPHYPSLGILEIKSTTVLFPGDGQHRAASIKEALKEKPELASQHIPVVLIPFTRKSQVRQLFSDLNLNAKPINKTIGLSFESRDPLAILTKKLDGDVGLFKGRINHKTNSLPGSSTNVVTINALYNANALVLKALGTDLDSLHGKKETDPAFVAAARQLADFWNLVVSLFPDWTEVMADRKTPGDVRHEKVFGFALGWQAIGHAAKVIIEAYPTTWTSEIKRIFQLVDWSQSNPDWNGVAMVGDRINNTSGGIRATAGYILEKGGVDAAGAKPYLEALNASRGPKAE